MRFVSYSKEEMNIVELVNEECGRIFEEGRASMTDAYGSFPDKALLIHSQEITEDITRCPEKYCDGPKSPFDL